jgi:alpha-amylase
MGVSEAMGRLASAWSSLAVTALIVSGCSSVDAGEQLPHNSQVGVQLFMWNWESVATECEDFLGSQGIDWVLVMPPQEHIQGAAWWTHYQPVSYQLESRLGTREQFQSMVTRCNDAGVDVIVDAVINHMAGVTGGVGWAGTTFERLTYTGLYSPENFHRCTLTPNGQIQNYRDREQVQTCDLLGLADLATGDEDVQDTIAAYLNDLMSLGVAGFRIDAAKHMAAADIESILSRVDGTPRVIHEVIRGGGEPIQPEEYLATGDAWEFDYPKQLRRALLRNGVAAFASGMGQRGNLPSEVAVTFVTNHDTERNGQSIPWNMAVPFELATWLMLADPYGQPMIYSSYSFAGYDDPPPLDGSLVQPASCTADENGFAPLSDDKTVNVWLCQHRRAGTAAMVAFRKAVGDAPLTHLYSDSRVIGFARDQAGYVIVNTSRGQDAAVSVDTSLPDGTYQNLLGSETLTITGGVMTTTLAPRSAIALLAPGL